MDSALTTLLLPLSLAVVMLRLGLSLTVDDIRRVGRQPRAVVADYFGSVGLVSRVFCLASLGLGYGVPRLLDVEHRQALASSMEVGIDNSTLAIAGKLAARAGSTSTPERQVA